jgi:deoxyribodipyrimidine photolyase
MQQAGITLGPGGYPRPIVDHGTARQEALDALATLG